MIKPHRTEGARGGARPPGALGLTALKSRPKAALYPDSIRIRGARQNNLKGFDLDLPLGKYVVVTGLSGAGKSSLVFDTIHAEGQRRYVETFSAYTRQFLDLLGKPRVDSIENIRPSIAIEQTNTVKTARSTVGTMTELTDYAKVWFSHAAQCYDPETGEEVQDDNPATIWAKTAAAHAGQTVVIGFLVTRPDTLSWKEIFTNLSGQGYTRVLLGTEGLAAARIDETLNRLAAEVGAPDFNRVFVVQDRVAVKPEQRSRFLEATETALHFGGGQIYLFADGSWSPAGHYSRGLHSPSTGRSFRAATPALFSFNSPLGACPRCRGFGRIIEIDYRQAIPDRSISIDDGAIKCWESEVYGESKRDLKIIAKKKKIRTDVPFSALPAEQQQFIIEGEPGYGEDNGKEWPQYWYGLKGFFRYLEKTTYKMHVRVFLSRFRAYNPCPDCHGTRLQPEALCWKWEGRTLPELYQLPVGELLAALTAGALARTELEPPGRGGGDHSADIAYESMITRLRYLQQVGLAYLTLDRSSKSLSGGEVQRVNLTSCLGTSLVDTLFVLDEPSVGLHPRDIDRLIAIIRTLTDAGNTVIVVEHDEAMIRAADHIVEIGPEPGEGGGHVVFQGTLAALLQSDRSITGAYLSGRRSIPLPATRRPPPTQWLEFQRVRKHNLRDLSFRLPLGRLVGLSGVSGSGKSTLLDNVIYQGLLAARQKITEDPAEIGAVLGENQLGEIVLVDQSPLSRTPRSNPALYCGAWDKIRDQFAATPAALASGFSSSSFSFNGGDGRCDHCLGLGYERVEMQFLSDVFVPCPVCEAQRFKPEILAIEWSGHSVAGVLAMSVDQARALFSAHPGIAGPLATLAAVGLGYLRLGQPLNTLSGGESQRLKLVRYLSDSFAAEDEAKRAVEVERTPGALLLLDEPTTGLHRHDVKTLLAVLHALVDRGHSVIVIEHNVDVLKNADWIVEVGPDAGAQGGLIVAEGTPDEIAAAQTATSPYLAPRELAVHEEALNERLLHGRAIHGGARPPGALDELSGLSDASAPSAFAAPERRPFITVTGARENNLKNLSLEIPHHSLNVVTGVSGSGKSTLAFDIVFAEGQRRFMESMSPYARQFVEQLPRPAIDRLTGIPPTVAIEQRVTRGSRKSTVATITEVAQYLRLLYARAGVQHHPDTDRPVTPLAPSALKKLLERVLATPGARQAKHLYLCAPVIRGRKGHHQPIAAWIAKQGYALMRADGKLTSPDAFQKLDRYKEHDIEIVVADLKADGGGYRGSPLQSGGKQRAAATPPVAKRMTPATTAASTTPGAALEKALKVGKGSCFLLTPKGEVLSWFSTTRTDAQSGESFPELDPKQFSFNSPRGWCPACRGHGKIYPWMLEPEDDDDDPLAKLRDFGITEADDVDEAGTPCPQCRGERLNRIARAVKLHLAKGEPISLPALLRGTSAELLRHLKDLPSDPRTKLVAQDIVPQIEERLKFLDHVGLGYLSLDRPTETLSGGEAQRIRLAAQLGSNLSGVLYVLDEPSIGLHAKDNDRLIDTLEALRDKGNTVLVVEHDDELMERADHIIDLGPAAGRHGGELLAEGTPAQIKRSDSSLTGVFLKRGIAHPLLGAYRPLEPETKRDAWLELTHATFRNLKGFDLRLPAGRLVMVSGPSGAGKSTLIRDVLQPAVAAAIEKNVLTLPGKAMGGGFKSLRLPHRFRSVITVDQSPIGKTPRSTPATYLGIFDTIRGFFASLPEAKIRGYTASRFSFNTAGGRCPTCDGAGRIRFEMAFMPDTYLPCDDCHGLRYGPELADIAWKDKNIGQVLQLTFEEAAVFFDFHSQLSQVCRLMTECGLGYLTLGQSSPTLSGGEAQRLKLVTELSRGLATYRERSRGNLPKNLYLLEEPTIGLHLSDCEKLIRVLQALVAQGHSVVVIEHNLDLLAEADYLIELGPVGGPAGGELLYQGAVAGLLKIKRSPTAPYLRKKLKPLR
jgi:excinuclease ABC subunit A